MVAGDADYGHAKVVVVVVVLVRMPISLLLDWGGGGFDVESFMTWRNE